MDSIEEDAEEEQHRLGELLFPVMADYADAVCAGDAAGRAEYAEQLRCLVREDVAPAAACEFVDVLGVVVTERWDEDRRAGLPAPGPPDGASLEESLRYTEQLLLELGSRAGAAYVLMARGRALHGRDDAGAVVALHRACGLFEELDLPQPRAACLAELAALRRQTGDHGGAAEDYRRAAELAERCGATDQARFWGVCAADAALAAGRDAAEAVRLDEALDRFREARAGYLAGGAPCAPGAANAALHLGITAFARHETDLAETWFRTADAEFDALADRGGAGAVHLAWGNALMSRGDAQAAEPLLRRAHGELVEVGHLAGAAACLRLLAASAFHRGDQARAGRLFAQAAQVLGDPESAVVAQLAELLAEVPHEATGSVLAGLRERLVDVGELGKAAGTAMLEVQELVRTGRREQARAAVARFEDLVARASADPRSRYALPTLSWMPALLTVTASDVGGPQERQAALRDCHEAMVAAGARLPAARLAVQLAAHDLAIGDARQAVDQVVPALLTLHTLAATLPDAGERSRWSVVVADAAYLAVRAAHQLGDHRLLAELLETVHGQAMPEPLAATEEEQSLDALLVATARLIALSDGTQVSAGGSLRDRLGDRLGDGLGGGLEGGLGDNTAPARVAPGAAATALAVPPAIRMPWLRLALEEHRAAAHRYGTDLDAAGVVRFTVAR